MSIPSTEWNQDDPPGTEKISLGDDEIRLLKKQIRELLEVNHRMQTAGHGPDWGKHEVINLLKQTSDPGTASEEGHVYQKVVDGTVELFFKDDSGNVSRLTNQGSVNFQRKYTAGTATVTGGGVDNTISGDSDTAWQSSAVSAGDVFWFDGESESYEIKSVDAEDQITLQRNYQGSSGHTNDSYIIGLNFAPQYVKQGGDLKENLDAKSHRINNHPSPSSIGDLLTRPAAEADISFALTKLDIGTYTGNTSSSQSITGVGWAPDLVITYPHASFDDQGYSLVFKSSADPDPNSYHANGWFDNQGITSLDADGFTVDDHQATNKDGTTYTYIAVRYA